MALFRIDRKKCIRDGDQSGLYHYSSRNYTIKGENRVMYG